MPQFDLANRLKVVQSFGAKSRTATEDGTSVDMKGHVGATVILNAGLVVGTAATIILEDSDDDTTFALVTAANQSGDIPATISTTEDDKTYRAAYLGKRRHLRVRLSAVGTSFVFSADIIQFPQRHA